MYMHRLYVCFTYCNNCQSKREVSSVCAYQGRRNRGARGAVGVLPWSLVNLPHSWQQRFPYSFDFFFPLLPAVDPATLHTRILTVELYKGLTPTRVYLHALPPSPPLLHCRTQISNYPVLAILYATYSLSSPNPCLWTLPVGPSRSWSPPALFVLFWRRERNQSRQRRVFSLISGRGLKISPRAQTSNIFYQPPPPH